MVTISKKVCLIGDIAVGKTSLVRRFVYNLFDDEYISTIGVKVSRKTVAVPGPDDVVELTIMLWDLAASEEFGAMRASYLRGAAGALLVCDLTRSDTFRSLEAYAKDLLAINPRAHIVLAGNKVDLVEQQQLGAAEMAKAAAELNAPYYLTSAKTGAAVERLFRHLGRLLLS